MNLRGTGVALCAIAAYVFVEGDRNVPIFLVVALGFLFAGVHYLGRAERQEP